MKPQLQTTANYDRFVYNDEQRKVFPSHVKDLMESMKRWGFLPSKPIQCYQKGAKLVIIDGHNRFIAAKNCQIPVFFVIESEDHQGSIDRVNAVVKPWVLENFIKMFVSRGIKDFIILSEYAQFGIPIRLAASLLVGTSVANLNSSIKSIKDGSFKIKDRTRIDAIKTLIEKTQGNPVFKSRSFITAIELVMRVKDFDMEKFTARCISNPKFIQREATTDQMLESIENL
jgi:hypothetical protein